MSSLSGPFAFLRPLGATGGAAIGFAVGHGVSPTIRPLVQHIANEAWELHQVRPLEPSVAAQLVAEGLWSGGQGEAEAAKSGINAERFSALVAEARRGPTIDQAFDGLRRGLLDGASFRDAMRQAGIRPEWDELMRALVDHVPSVQDMVRFAVREAYSPDVAERFGQYDDFPEAFARDAENVGLTRERARQYWAAHWDLPSAEQGFAMFHRGIISRDDLELLLRALDVMPFWRDRLIDLVERLPPVSDMIRFGVREVYTPDVRRRFGLDDEYPERFGDEAAKHGLSDENARNYWAAHWELPSVEQAFRMRHRDAIDDAELDLLLRTRDVMPFWREKLRSITYLVPGRVDLRRMFRADVITEQEVQDGYVRLGYTEEDARTLTDFAVAEKRDAGTRGSLVPLYRRRVVAAIHREYLHQQLDEAQARDGLEALGIPQDTIGELLPLWDLERQMSRRELTVADVRKAYKENVYTREQAIAELAERLMPTAEAEAYLDSA